MGGNPTLIFCACMGGAAFGDNLGLISDTTMRIGYACNAGELKRGLQAISRYLRIQEEGK